MRGFASIIGGTATNQIQAHREILFLRNIVSQMFSRSNKVSAVAKHSISDSQNFLSAKIIETSETNVDKSIDLQMNTDNLVLLEFIETFKFNPISQEFVTILQCGLFV